MGQPPEEKTEYSKMEPGVEQRNRKFIQSLITSRQRQHCSGVNNRAVLWVHVAATASIHFSDLQRLFAFLISLFSWEFRSPYRRHLAFSLLFSSLLFPSLLFFSLLFSSLLFSFLLVSSFRALVPSSSEIYANTRNNSPRNVPQRFYTRLVSSTLITKEN